MKTMIIFVCLPSLLLLMGCVGMVPLPPESSKTYGKVIEKSQIQFIVAGQTKRDEVTARLGSQFRDSPRMAALAYSWEKPAAGMVWWAGGMEAGATGYFERSHWRAYFVAFDGDGKVCRTEFVSLSQHKSLDEQLEDWAQRHGAATTPVCTK